MRLFLFHCLFAGQRFLVQPVTNEEMGFLDNELLNVGLSVLLRQILRHLPILPASRITLSIHRRS